jgi:hypothetical protein
MQAKNARYVWFLAFLLFISLGCSLINGVGESLTQTKATAEHIATQVQKGRDAIETAQGFATQVGESGFLETLQAAATDVGETGIFETAQAFATQQGPSLLGTAQAIATQEGPSMIATVQALGTDLSESLGEAPEDIPIVGGERENVFESKETVSYMTPMPFQLVVGFYKNEMPLNGWTPIQEGSFEAEHTAVLHFAKPERGATVTLTTNPLTDDTIVLVTIQSK